MMFEYKIEIKANTLPDAIGFIEKKYTAKDIHQCTEVSTKNNTVSYILFCRINQGKPCIVNVKTPLQIQTKLF